MKRAFVFATSAMAVVSASADAGVIGFAAFSRIASNGNRVIDVVAVMQNANDRLLNVYGADLRNNAGAGGASFFTQQAGAATRGWKPDAASSTRSSIVDSFCTIGVEGGSPYEGQYYAAGATSADGNFSTGWTTLGNTVPPLAGWFLSPPTLPDNRAESLANFSGTRINSNAAAGNGLHGVWMAHLVMSGSATSCTLSITAASKDGLSGSTVTASISPTNALEMIPAPGAVSVLAFAGLAARRRRG